MDILEISFPSTDKNKSGSYLKLDLTGGNSLLLKNENLAQSVSLASAVYNLSHPQHKVTKLPTFEWLSLPKKKTSELEEVREFYFMIEF